MRAARWVLAAAALPPSARGDCATCTGPKDTTHDNCYHADWSGSGVDKCSKEESAEKCRENDNGEWCKGSEPTPPPSPPAPSSGYPADKVRLIGRWYPASGAIGATSWGRSFALRFRGSSSASASLSAPAALYYTVSVDNATATRVKVAKGDSQLQLASKLDPAAEHTIVVGRSDEAAYGVTTLRGVSLDSGYTALDPPAPRGLRYEALGDSITAGWNVGQPAGSEKDGGVKGEDVFRTYEALLAQAWGSDDWRAIARSGIGAVEIDGELGLGAQYTCADFHEGSGCPRAWDFSAWQADVVTVNLGTNDYSATATEPTQAAFLKAYGGLLALAREKNPGATIFAICPLQYSCPEGAAGKYDPAKWGRMFANIQQAVTTMGDAKVHFIETGTSDDPWLDCDAETVDGTHPTAEGHRKFAARLQKSLAPLLPHH